MYNNAIKTDVLSVKYDSSYVYVNTNSVPSYSIGPWTANPNTPSAQNAIAKFALKPSNASTASVVGLGPIGLWSNGVAIFNGLDGMTYNTVWHRNAYFFEGISFDSCNGHPSNYFIQDWKTI